MRTFVAALGLVFIASLAAAGESGLVARRPAPAMNPNIVGAESNKWVKLHVQKTTDKVRFKRQAHGGSCYDSRRGRLVLFGSNTHGRDWKNSPFFFDVARCEWTRAYQDDSKDTYKVNAAGLPVCGEKGDRPWAMHTFGAVIYDPGRDEMVVACMPGHMNPAKFTRALAHLWKQVKQHPTWTYSFETGKWKPLPGKAAHFFPNAAAWDSDRKSVVGYGGRGIHELAGEPREWQQLPGRSMFGWHNNMAYDSKNKAMVVFGTNRNSNDVVTYKPETREHKKMPTEGTRPPEDQHNPMCFDTKNGVTVMVIDKVLGDIRDKKAKREAQTWIYDLGKDTWTKLPAATLPFGCRMNYNMEYDSRHGACLLVATPPGSQTTVFALKLSPAALGKKKPAPARPE